MTAADNTRGYKESRYLSTITIDCVHSNFNIFFFSNTSTKKIFKLFYYKYKTFLFDSIYLTIENEIIVQEKNAKVAN